MSWFGIQGSSWIGFAGKALSPSVVWANPYLIAQAEIEHEEG